MNWRRRSPIVLWCERSCMHGPACVPCVFESVGVAAAGCAARASVDIWALSTVGALQPSKHSNHYNSRWGSRRFLVGALVPDQSTHMLGVFIPRVPFAHLLQQRAGQALTSVSFAAASATPTLQQHRQLVRSTPLIAAPAPVATHRDTHGHVATH